MIQAEMMLLAMRDLIGKTRLSCQLLCEYDMKVGVLMTVGSTGARNTGYPPERRLTPLPIWLEKPEGDR